MAIQHKDVQDPDIHEPKGASTANSDTSYFADGLGSGIWRKARPINLDGVSGPSEGDMILVGPSGTSFTSRRSTSFGSMLVLDNSNGFTVSAAADSSLTTNSDYTLFTGNGAPWQADSFMDGVSFRTDRLTVNVTGIYKIDLWGVIKAFPTNTSSIGVKYRRNGTLFGPAKAIIKSNSAGDYGNVSAFGILQLSAGDYVQLMVASTSAGTVTFDSIRLTLQLMKATI